VRLTVPVPRPPFGPDPLRRIDVPRDLSAITAIGDEADPHEAGMSRDQVETIWRGAEQLYRSGVHPAIQLCLRREGLVVLDRAIGHARGNGPLDTDDDPKVAVSPQTPFVIYSAAKAITAVVAHLLDERGDIHLGDRVCEYIPEYAKHGKQAITIAHVLSHRAGVPNVPREAFDLDLIEEQDKIIEVLCEAKPRTRPGKLLSYHAVSGGFIIGEVVRRVTGRTIREVLADEFLEPLGFRWGNFGVAPEDVGEVGLSYLTGAPVIPPISLLLQRALGVGVKEVVELSNDPRFLRGIVPAANTVTSGHELARFYDVLGHGGELDGVRVMEARTIRRALAEQSYLEIDLTLGAPLRYSLGFMLGAKRLSLYGPDTEHAFGHLGFTNIIGWADPERALAGGLITSGKPVLYPEMADLWNLMRTIGRETPKAARSPLGLDPT
jgi:CubicO group peptidase (beta-lactamase class C family)